MPADNILYYLGSFILCLQLGHRSRKDKKNNTKRNIHQENNLEKKPKLRIKDQMRLSECRTEGIVRDELTIQ